MKGIPGTITKELNCVRRDADFGPLKYEDGKQFASGGNEEAPPGAVKQLASRNVAVYRREETAGKISGCFVESGSAARVSAKDKVFKSLESSRFCSLFLLTCERIDFV